MGIIIAIIIVFVVCSFVAANNERSEKESVIIQRNPSQNKKEVQSKKPVVSVSWQTTTRQELEQTETQYNNPLEERSRNSDTDYSNVTFLELHTRKRAFPMPDGPDDYGRYISYNLKINDPVKKFKEFISKGYFREATAEETLKTYKVVELKEMLKNHNLTVSGKKADLISRLLSSVDVSELHLSKMYCVSDAGLDFINAHEDLIKLSTNPYSVTYEEYIATKKEAPPYLKYNDIIWAVFKRRDMYATHYGAKAINSYHRAEFLKAESKMTDALSYYIAYMYYELNDPSRVIPEEIKQYYTEEQEPEQLSEYLLEDIFELKDYFKDEMVDRCYKRIDVPKILIKRKDFERLLNDIFSQNKIDVKNYLPKGLR